MLAASPTVSIALVIFAIILVGFIVFAVFNVRAGRDEIASEIELAANRKPYHDDEALEGPRLERVQILGVLFLLVIAVALPMYWVFEPGRQAGAKSGLTNRLASWGGELFETTANGGFNCAGCHGSGGGGGSAPYTIVDPLTGEPKAVSWNAPALNTIFYRYSADEVRFILTYGRPFSPMSPWGLEGGGPMNSQQIDALIEKLRALQLPPESCVGDVAFDTRTKAAGGKDPAVCDGGLLPADKRAEIDGAIAKAMKDGGISRGEAIYNLATDSGAYSCARCHTSGWSWGDPGTPGSGAFGWNLTGSSLSQHFPVAQENIDFVKSGSVFGKKYGRQGQGSGRMPGFGHYYTDDQLKDVIEYVRGL